MTALSTAILAFSILLPIDAAVEPGPGAAPPRPAAPEGKRPVTDRPNLGVQLRSAQPGGDGGILVASVYPGSAAAAMGLLPGDEIVEMDGVPLPNRAAIVRELQRREIGSRVEFKVRRGGEPRTVAGTMGSFRKTRDAFLESLRREVTGKPFATVATIEWPDGIDGIAALKGKVGIVVAIDGCRDCLGGNWRKFRMRWDELSRLGQTWIGICGIFSNSEQPHEKNLRDRSAVLSSNPAPFPLGIARYPGDRPPLDSLRKEPLIQSHGVAILDPDGKILYLEIPGFEPDNPALELGKALEEAARKYGPSRPAPTTGEKEAKTGEKK